MEKGSIGCDSEGGAFGATTGSKSRELFPTE